MDGFKLALEIIGFNEPTHQLIIDNEFVNIRSLSSVLDADVTKLIEHIGRWKERYLTAAAGADAPPTVTLPFISVIKLQAMRTWFSTQ